MPGLRERIAPIVIEPVRLPLPFKIWKRRVEYIFSFNKTRLTEYFQPNRVSHHRLYFGGRRAAHQLSSWPHFLISPPCMDKGPPARGSPNVPPFIKALAVASPLPSLPSSSTASCCILWLCYRPPPVSRRSHRSTWSAACSVIH